MANDNLVSPEGVQEFLDPAVPPEEQLMSPDSVMGLMDGTDTTGQKRRDNLTGQIAAAKGRLMDEQELALADLQPDPKAALATAAEEVFQNLESVVAAGAVTEVSNNPQGIPQAMTRLNENMSHVNALRNHPVAEELAVIQNSATVPLTAAVHEEIAFNLGVRNEISRMLDEQGMLDYILDLGGTFIPTRNTMEWEDIKTNIGSHKKLGQWLTGESIAGMISSWQVLPLDRKQALYPTLVQTILDSTGVEGGILSTGNLTDKNTQIAVAALVRFFQPEGAERASLEQKALLGLDIISLAPLGALGKTGKVSGAFRFSTKPKPDAPFPRTDPAKGITLEGEVVGSTTAAVQAQPLEVRRAMEGIMMGAAEHSNKSHNIIKLMKEGGDTPQAARATVASMDSESIRRAVGISVDDAVTNAMPFQTNDWLPQATKDLVPDIAQELNDFLRIAEGKVRSMTTESDLLRVGALSQSDRKRVVVNFFEEMERVGEDYLQEGIHLSEVKMLKEDAQSFEFEYTLTNASGFSEAFKGRRSWGINQATGNFEETVKELAEKPTIPGLSPAAWSVTKSGSALDFNDVVKQALQLEDVAVASKQRINDLWVDANKTIGNLTDVKARARIEDIELAGDEFVNPDSQERGRTFLPRELHAGITTRSGTIRLTNPKEVEAYYKRRLVADAFHNMENFVGRRELELGGFKSYVVSPPAGEQLLFTKPFDDLSSALQSTANKPGFGVWDSATKQVQEITPEYLTEAYEKGKVLGRLREDWNTAGNEMMRGGEYVEYVLLDPNKVKQLPDQVLNYKFGYVPKINEGVEFVVQQNFPIAKRGTQGRNRSEALRAFSSRKDADLFVERMAQQYAVKQSIPVELARDIFQVSDGSVMGQLERMENSLSGSAGLFTGSRSKDDLLMGLEGVPMERMSPSEAYGRYIDHLGTKVSKNEWRIGKEKEWINSVRKALPETRLQGFNGTVLPNDETGAALERLRGQISKWNAVPSRKESLFAANTQKMHDWVLEGTRGLGIEKQNIKSLLWLKHAEPGAAMMAANMHVFLGALNPAQLYVQASAATVALSLAPIAAIPNIIRNAARFSGFDNVKDATTMGKIITLLKRPGPEALSAADAEMYMAWSRSGLRESVRSNADMNYISNTGLGVTNDVLRNAGNVSLAIYRSAELANRRISFITAFTNARKAKPTAKLDDDFIADVLVETNKFMLELNAANKAWWQGGAGATATQKVLANTTQFQQVLTKTLELVVKGERRGGFTSAQKSRIAAGQMLAFGSAGVPFIAMIGPAFVDWVSDKAGLDDTNPDDVQIKESIANTFNQGSAGYIAHEMLGAKVEVAGRGALSLGVLTSMKEIVTSEDPMWLKLLGVGGVTLQRVGETAARTSAEVAAVAKAELRSHGLAELAGLEPLLLADRRGSVPVTREQWIATAADIGQLLIGIPTTTRSLLKQRMMTEHNKIRDRRGRTVIDNDFSLSTEIAVALGFRTTQETRLDVIKQDNQYYKELIQEARDVVIAAEHRWVYTHDKDPAHGRNLVLLKQEIQATLGNDYLVEQLRTAIDSAIYDNPQTREQRELLTAFNRHASDKVTQGLIIDSGNMLNPSNIFNKQAVVVPFADTVKGTLDAGE